MGKAFEPNDKPKNYTRNDKEALMTLENGVFKSVQVSKQASDRLSEQKPENLKRYLQACFAGEITQTDDERRQDNFFRVYEKTQCLACRDSGLIILDVERPGGRVYSTGYACICTEGVKYQASTGSVYGLINGFNYKRPCQLADESGFGCYHKAKCAKASSFIDCGKFKQNPYSSYKF